MTEARPAGPPPANQSSVLPTPRIEGGSSAGFHIPSLDGIRAVAILIVFLSHAGLSSVIPGIFGVTIFFFLSGYLITTLLRLEIDRHGHINFKQFYLRRTLRIFPPLYAYLLLTLVLAWVGLIQMPRLAAFLSEVFYVTNFYLNRHGSGGFGAGSVILWSLAIEEHFYLLFPLLYVLLRKSFPSGRAQGMWLFAGCGIVMLWRCWLVHALPRTGLTALRIDHGTDTRFDSLLFGCALALWGNPALETPLWSEATLKRLMLPLAVIVLLLTLFDRSDTFRDSVRFTLQGLALLPLFTAAIRYPTWPIFVPLNWAPVRFVGVLSYTIYLVHLTALTVIARFVHNGWAAAVGAAAGALLIATASYYLLELPCARLRKRYSRVGRTSPEKAHGS